MAVTEASIAAVLRARAQQQPDAPAYTFIDYELDPQGYSQTLTWSQLHQRAQVVAGEFASYGSPGERVAILAPQGLEYIVGFFAALEAGFIAVPLPVPQFGAHDERASAALRDSSPSVILTTSAAVDDVVSCARGLPGTPPAVIEIDALDLDATPTFQPVNAPHTKIAVLQYTSGSTRSPAAVVVTHKNILANLEQVQSDYFEAEGKVPPPDLTTLSWLPIYHDMGLLLGITGAVTIGLHSVLMSPMAFLQRPARWVQQMALNTRVFTAVPNFAFELAARRTTDEDMAGLDLSDVHTVLSGSERVHAATIRRFLDRFSAFNFQASSLKPSYGLAEAMVYVNSSGPGRPPTVATFDYEKLSAGHAEACDNGTGVELVGVGTPRASTVRIVDPETRVENPAGMVGEVWLHGDNIANGYWRKPQQTQRTFGGQLVDPSPGTPLHPWLRTGDLGVIHDGELFIIGRIKDLLIVDGRNHYPDDIEATTQEISGGRVAAISIEEDRTERLIVIAEMKNRGASEEDMQQRLRAVRQQVTSAISKSHGLRVADLVLVPPGSIPITTSGKIRRSSCVEVYRQDEFSRLDSTA
ncbi:MAG: long-chain fatty acid adenylase/transferase FadD26 [Mycobacterium sp.]|jgi:long chain fatty acid CoA FadD26|nr:long-chain fatty acid adenylase/transferase FadD26 [Mycobacterium sp.]MDT5342293.1 long-chain fatty acid adenylase/transferase FadD26 [Mycobacterium sp.]